MEKGATMRWFCTVPLLILLSAASAGASSITLTTDPANGAIAGAPGSTIGWGFSLTSTYTTEWVSFTGSALTFETNPTVGTYTDFIGLQGGPLPFFAVAPSTTWSQTFDAVMQQGIGSYAIDPGAILSSQNIGSLLLFFDIFDSDPL